MRRTPSCEPLSTNPSVKHIQRSFGLVVWHHVTRGVDADEGEIAAGLDLPNVRAISQKIEVAQRYFVVRLLARPF